MGSRTFTLLAALSAVLCVGMGALWARSYIWLDAVGPRPLWWRQPGVVSREGVLLVAWPAELRGRGHEWPMRWDSFRLRGTSESKSGPVSGSNVTMSLFLLLKLQLWDPVGPSGFAYRVEFHEDDPWDAGLAAGALPGVPGPRKWHVAAAPHWAWMAAASVLPTAWVVGRCRVRRRGRTGRCVACGYDLRAGPDAAGALLSKCPKCGAVPK